LSGLSSNATTRTTNTVIIVVVVVVVIIIKRRLPSNLRPTTRECMPLVKRGQSGHVTKLAVTPFDRPYPKTPHCTQTSWCLAESELLPIEVLNEYDICDAVTETVPGALYRN